MAAPFKLRERFRTYFFAGILVTGPIALTLYIAWWFIGLVDATVGALLPDRYNPGTYLPFHVPGIGLVVAVVGLTLIGALTAGYLGRVFVRVSDRVLARMPVVRGIYSATKQIFETVLSKQSTMFREVVLVEWPRRDMWTVAFVTVPPEGELKELNPPDSIGVYVPTTPNPTSGYLIYVPRKDVRPIGMSVEEGIKLVVSGGIVVPDKRKPAK
ncbi:MAG TPA: DUF502 domain-containing protein [Stellaceae bacterium]|nr:DUF502 domain-containing protein [Stellaceae bacterium]